MPQSIGNHNYQVFARNSAGVYSQPVSISANVVNCGASSGAYFSLGVNPSSSVPPSGLYVLAPNSNIYPQNTVSSNVYKILKYDANDTDLIGVTRAETIFRVGPSGANATLLISITGGFNIQSISVVKRTGDIIVALSSSTSGFPQVRKYSSTGTLLATKEISATPFSRPTVATNFDGTSVYVGTLANSTGSIRKLDGATLQTEIWTQNAFGVADIQVTQDSREQVWILDNGASGNANPDIFRRLDKDNGNTITSIQDSPFASANSFAITPNQAFIFSQVSNTNPSSTKIVKIDTNTNAMTTFSTIPGNTILSISRDGAELFAAALFSTIQVFDVNTGVLKRQYPAAVFTETILAQ